MLTRQLIWRLTDKLSFWFCCFLRDVTLYEHVCTRMCSLVASTPAVCFSAVVSSANRNTGLITCLKCQDIENHVVICFKNGSVLTLTDQLIAILWDKTPLRHCLNSENWNVVRLWTFMQWFSLFHLNFFHLKYSFFWLQFSFIFMQWSIYLNPLIPKIWLIILPSSCYTIPCILITRIYCQTKIRISTDLV